MTAYLVVRAVVADPNDRAAFDRWYRTEHLPDAVKAFKAAAAMRGWSTVDPSVHTAYYRFDTLDQVQAISDSAEIRGLIASLTGCGIRAWCERATSLQLPMR